MVPGEKMTNKETLQAIMRTLGASVNSGLNATFTPDDCRALLELIANMTRRSSRRGPLNSIFDTVNETVSEYLNELINDLRKGKL